MQQCRGDRSVEHAGEEAFGRPPRQRLARHLRRIKEFPVPLGGDDGKWAFGYTAGAGGELKLTDRWSLRGEYRYLRFGLDRSSRSGNGSINLGSSFVNAFSGTTRTQVDLNLEIGRAHV